MKKKVEKQLLPGPVYDVELRTAAGNIGQYQNGFYLSLGQDGESHSMSDFNSRYASIHWVFGLTPMNNGKWLSSQFDYTLYAQSSKVVNGRFQKCDKMFFDTREQALRATIAKLLRLARSLRRSGGTLNTIDQQEYEQVVAWLYQVLGTPAPMLRTPRGKPLQQFHYLPEEMDTMVLSAEEALNPQLLLLKEC